MGKNYAGKDMAIMASKVFALEIDRHSQSAFAMFRGHKTMHIHLSKKPRNLWKNITEKITVEDLAVMFAIGKRHFKRCFKRATNNTPSEYIQRVKIEAAKKELETTGKNISEVMYEMGYSDLKAFRIAFKKVTGLTPIEYRSKYNKVAAVA